MLRHVVRIDERTLQLADLPQQLQVGHVHVDVTVRHAAVNGYGQMAGPGMHVG